MVGQGIHITTDVQVYTGGGRLAYVHLAAGAGTAATLTLYDSAAATPGAELATLAAVAGGNDSWGCGIAIPFSTGIYADIGGAGASADVVLA